ncbi:MAG: glucokinase [Gammaproteobacteria bacterium]|nr:glucokinase [Gammaproteobacteria bacterium]MDH5734552.1 glucokinase [Gammaproteobacteria bacterium]
MKIVAADIGGTKSIFSLSDTDELFNLLYLVKYKSNDFKDFYSLLDRFYKDAGLHADEEVVLSLALPGVVDNNRSELTNLSWVIDKNNIKDKFNVNKIILINDFQAAVLGVDHVSKDECVVLNEGQAEVDGVRVVVGAGTGLGLAWSVSGNGLQQPFSTEGGHIDFAPVNNLQIQLLDYLMPVYGHVSYERLLSGDGLVNIYRFLCGASASSSAVVIDAAWVNQQAADNDAKAIDAIKLFCDIYGAYIGNLGLLFKPGKGIFVAGGIAPKILPWIRSDQFRNSYLQKGRMTKVLEKIQVNLITDERLGLFGAITVAMSTQE